MSNNAPKPDASAAARRAEEAQAEALSRSSEETSAVEGGAGAEVPAGGAGADSGAADSVGVDEATEESAAGEARSYSSYANDEPGIGNRGGDGADRV